MDGWMDKRIDIQMDIMMIGWIFGNLLYGWNAGWIEMDGWSDKRIRVRKGFDNQMTDWMN